MRGLAYFFSAFRVHQENEQLRTQLEALRTRDPREKELKTTKIMNTQLKLYKETENVSGSEGT